MVPHCNKTGPKGIENPHTAPSVLLPELPVLPVTEPTVRVRLLELAIAMKYAMTATATMITAMPVSTDESTISGVL